jgi:hypothetical protein
MKSLISIAHRRMRAAAQDVALRAASHVALAFTLTVLVAPDAHAQRDKYVPLVLQLPTNARILSMGGGGVASADADVIFRNPSLVGQSSEMSFSLAHYAAPPVPNTGVSAWALVCNTSTTRATPTRRSFQVRRSEMAEARRRAHSPRRSR